MDEIIVKAWLSRVCSEAECHLMNHEVRNHRLYFSVNRLYVIINPWNFAQSSDFPSLIATAERGRFEVGMNVEVDVTVLLDTEIGPTVDFIKKTLNAQYISECERRNVGVVSS